MPDLPPRAAGADPRLHHARTVAADPTSLALLLSGPATLDVWPGVSRGADAARGHLVLDIDLPAPTTLLLRVESPVRTATSYVLRFSATGEEFPTVDGALRITRDASRPVGDGPAVAGSLVELDLHPHAALLPGVRDVVGRLASDFLDVVTAAGEGRAAAA